jgi:hypothetical protein
VYLHHQFRVEYRVDAVTSEKVCKECGRSQIYGGEEGMDSAVLTFISKMEAANSFEM